MRAWLSLLWPIGLAAAEHAAPGDHGDPFLAWKWANFAILAGLLGWLIAKTAGPFFRNRAEDIRKAIADAQKALAEADGRAAAIEKRISNLGTELDALRANARKEMEAESARIQEDTRKAMARIREGAEVEILSMTTHAESELKRHAADLALDLARKKIEGAMNPEVQASLVHRFVNNLRQSSGSMN